MTHRDEEPAPTGELASLRAELDAVPHEPLLPVEKRLIAGSLLLGLLLLGLLLWISATYFPVVPGARQ
jgi:hypothetical protein